MGTPRNFGEFRRALASLARVPAAISPPVAVGIRRLMRRAFRAGETPYGSPYEPLTIASLERGRVPPPLHKYEADADATPLAGGGVAVTVAHPQSGFHQTGTSRMAKRIVVPDRAVPSAWRAVIAREFKKSIRARLGKAA